MDQVLRLRTMVRRSMICLLRQSTVAFGGERGISPALALLIAQTVQAGSAAERSAHRSPPIFGYTATIYVSQGS